MGIESSSSLNKKAGRRSGQVERLCKRALAALFLTIMLLGAQAFAQLTTADILGTVTDASGAVIPNATVVVKNIGTNEERTVQTNGAGEYTVPILPVGHYSISVKAPGFESSITNDLAVEAGDRARNDVKLVTGAGSTTVEVQASTPLLQADNATVSSTVTAKAVQDLPLNGRNFVQLVALVPGANEGQGNGLSSGGRPDDRRTNAAGLSINGQDESLNNWVVDGVDDNERIIGTIGIKPNVEGIQEITTETNSYAAEAGRTAGGVINIITRSGTNQFHGSAYEYFRNDIFDARNFFQTTGGQPELRQNQYGASVGGPVFKDKTFFFFDWEGFRQVSGVTDTGTVPVLSEYNAINSIGGSTPQSLLSTYNGTLQAYKAGTPINPITLNYLKLFPAPTNGNLTNNFTISPSKTQNYNTYDARVDHRINEANVLFARFSYNKVNTVTPPNFGTVDGVQISGGRYNFDGPATNAAQQWVLGYTHTFTPAVLLDLRAGYTRINNLSLPLNYGKGVDQSVIGFPASMTSFSPFADSLTPVSIGPFGDIGDGAYVPLQDIDNTFQYNGAVSWTKGVHNFKFGGGLIRRQARNVQSASAVGAYGFNLSSDTNGATNEAAATGQTDTQLLTQNNQIASALLGGFNNQSRNFNLSPPDYRAWEPSAFAQDSWKITPQLTLLLGVRYDVYTPFTEAHNHISNYDYLEALGNPTAAISSALKIAGVNGVSDTTGIATKYDNVAPRVGFAYSVSPTTVFRGGYGLSYFPGNYTSNGDLKNAPFTSVYAPACQSNIAVQLEALVPGSSSGQNPSCGSIGQPGTINTGIPVPAAPSAAQLADLRTIPGLSFVAEATNFRSALIQQFNVQMEQQLGANVFIIGYVGNIGQHLPESINNINQPLPFNVITNPGGAARPLDATFTPAPTAANPTPTSNLSGISYLASEGISNYNALQTSFQRRFTKGLAFDMNYTWAKALSDITGFSEQGDQGWSNVLPTNIRATEYGTSEDQIKNRFALSLNYELQYGNTFTGVKRALLHGWEANTIAVWQTGKPFTIINSGNGGADNQLEADGKLHSYGNFAVPQNAGGNDRPDTIGGTTISNKSINEYFNVNAFAPQPLGTIGNTQRNSMIGPNFRHVDLSLFKDFPVTERVNLQFRVESFNISNTPNFFIANNNSGSQELGNAAFGTISATDPNYTPRQYQFVLKAQF